MRKQYIGCTYCSGERVLLLGLHGKSQHIHCHQCCDIQTGEVLPTHLADTETSSADTQTITRANVA